MCSPPDLERESTARLADVPAGDRDYLLPHQEAYRRRREVALEAVEWRDLGQEGRPTEEGRDDVLDACERQLREADLSLGERTVWWHRVYYGHADEEIARCLGVTVRTVRLWGQSAKRKVDGMRESSADGGERIR